MRAEVELSNVLADVRRGIWKPPEPPAVEAPRQEPTFHEFASEWFEGKRHELASSTADNYKWALSNHLLPFFKSYRLSQITAAEVDRYKNGKLRERERGRSRLSNNSINETLVRLAQVLELAVEYGYLDRNPARGRARRLKGEPRRRASMAAEQVGALLEAAGTLSRPGKKSEAIARQKRGLLATAIMAGGLRVSEVTALRWRNVDLAGGRLTVEKSKTEAGVRVVDLTPDLRDELAAYKASLTDPDGGAFLFPGRATKTKTDLRRDRGAVLRRILKPAIKKANEALQERGHPTIGEAVTFHSLRRTYASLMAEAGADPAYTAAQIGHRSARFTLDIYTDVGRRRQAANTKLDSLTRGADWAPMGTSNDSEGRTPKRGLEAKEPYPAASSGR